MTIDHTFPIDNRIIWTLDTINAINEKCQTLPRNENSYTPKIHNIFIIAVFYSQLLTICYSASTSSTLFSGNFESWKEASGLFKHVSLSLKKNILIERPFTPKKGRSVINGMRRKTKRFPFGSSGTKRNRVRLFEVFGAIGFSLD